MNCLTARERLPELLLAAPDQPGDPAVSAHLLSCPDCQREHDSLRRTLDALDAVPTPRPSLHLRQAVQAAIAAEKQSQRDSAPRAARGRPTAAPTPARSAWLRLLLPLAACALVALGFLAGRRSAPPPSTPTPAGDPATRIELARLNARLDAVSQAVESSLLPRHPGNERLQRVLAQESVARPDSRVTAGLIETLALDPSVNVRLNALEALYAHADQAAVRAGVTACLAREPSALVQVAMIDFLVGARDRDAAPEFRKLLTDTRTDLDVRESARRALDQL
jgi:hypothetical protein